MDFNVSNPALDNLPSLFIRSAVEFTSYSKLDEPITLDKLSCILDLSEPLSVNPEVV